MTQPVATLIGFTAVIVWSTLAALTVVSAPVPPLLLNALTCGIGGLAGLIWAAASGRLSVLREVPPGVILFGSLCLFGYHGLYFAALRLVPPAEASLMNYTWPLLIVLLSGVLLGERLRRGHILGAMIGFSGLVLVLWSGGAGFGGLKAGHLLGLACALVWAVYSVISRRLAGLATESVALFCLGNAVLALAGHLLFESPAWPAEPAGWLAILLIGLGPAGLAFFVWDIGMKHGDIRLLAAASYAAPVLSTLLLVAIGSAVLSWQLVAAVALITAGSVISLRASRAASQDRESAQPPGDVPAV